VGAAINASRLSRRLEVGMYSIHILGRCTNTQEAETAGNDDVIYSIVLP
jgi:hypothetical protein